MNTKHISTAIIIPTHNRPTMLAEAIESIAQQENIDLSLIEIIVIDDNSSPPVDFESVHGLFIAGNLKLHRNNESYGLAYNRDKGVQLTKADIVIHLDDDDKLAQNALSEINKAYDSNPGIDIVLMGVGGFGPRKSHLEKANNIGLENILGNTTHKKDNNNIQFTSSLFQSLLKGVPVCFQNYAVKKTAWKQTNDLRIESYFKTERLDDHDQNMRKLSGPLRDSEWIIYASLLCKICLIDLPIYLVRCEGQGFVSHVSHRERQVNAHIAIKQQLANASEYTTELQPFKQQIKLNMADTFFNEAYYQLHTLHNRKQALKYWIKAQITNGKFSYYRFFIHLCLPRALLSAK